LLINPYDAAQFAETLATALAMKAEERAARMHLSRATVEHNNIYRWAGKVVSTLTSLSSTQEPNGCGSAVLSSGSPVLGVLEDRHCGPP
jgi:trehalose-6-phosphate synthase